MTTDGGWVRLYSETWLSNSMDLAKGPLYSFGAFCSIIAAFGLKFSFVGWWGWLLPIGFFIFILFRSRPRNLKFAASMINQPGQLKELEQVLRGPERQVGLVGLTSTGKTTFRDMLANRPDTVRTTENTYEIFRVIPPSENEELVTLIDSVGQNQILTAEVVSRFPNIVVFVDHSESDNELDVKRGRVMKHREFFRIISKVIGDRKEHRPRVFLVANKSDLWHDKPDASRQMSNLLKYGRKTLNKVLADQEIFTIESHSCKSGPDNTNLLHQVLNHAK